MKLFLTIILLAVTSGCFAQETFNYQTDFKDILAKTKDPNDHLAYEKLLSRFSALDTTLTDYEVLALLIGFTDKPDYKPYDYSTEKEIWKLYDRSKYQKAVDLGKKYLNTHPLSIKALFGVAYSCQQLRQDSSARYYAYQVLRIFRAMRFSGNGKAPENPIFSLGASDGYDYINKFVNTDVRLMDPDKDKNGNLLDVLIAKLEDGQIQVYYFIIEHAARKKSGAKKQ